MAPNVGLSNSRMMIPFTELEMGCRKQVREKN